MSQSDLLGDILCGAEVDEVEYVDFPVLQTLVSISIEMSGQFGFLHVLHYMVEVLLKSLFQTVLGLTDILFLASSAAYTVDQVFAAARHVVFRVVYSVSKKCHDVAFPVQQVAIPALQDGACHVDQLGWFTLLLL